MISGSIFSASSICLTFGSTTSWLNFRTVSLSKFSSSVNECRDGNEGLLEIAAAVAEGDGFAYMARGPTMKARR